MVFAKGPGCGWVLTIWEGIYDYIKVLKAGHKFTGREVPVYGAIRLVKRSLVGLVAMRPGGAKAFISSKYLHSAALAENRYWTTITRRVVALRG